MGMDWRQWLCVMHVGVWILFLGIFFNNLSSGYSSLILKNGQCTGDINCHLGMFCNMDTRYCVNCTDCSKFRLMPGQSNCAKSKKDCGGCQHGFILDNGNHCTPSVGKASLDVDPVKNPDKGGSGGGISIWLVGVVIALPFLLFFAYKGIWKHYKKRHFTTENSQGIEVRSVSSSASNNISRCESAERNLEKKGSLAMPEEYGNPPPYNVYFESNPSNAHVVIERLQSAVPIDLGNFPSSQPENQTFEQNGDAVVPDLDVQAEPSEATAMLLDPQASNTQLDLNSLMSNENEIEGTIEIESTENSGSASLASLEGDQQPSIEARSRIGDNNLSSATTGRRTLRTRRQTATSAGTGSSSSMTSTSCLQSNEEARLDMSIPSTFNTADVQMPLFSTMNDSGNESGNEEQLFFALSFVALASIGTRTRNNSQPHFEVRVPNSAEAHPALQHAQSHSAIDDTVLDLSAITDFHNGSADSGMEANEPNVSRIVPDEDETEDEDDLEPMDES